MQHQPTYIDWHDILDELNDRYGPFKDEKSAHEHVYKKAGSIIAAADIIGVSHTTLGKRYHHIGIDCKRKPKKDALHRKLMEYGTAGKTAKELFAHFGVSENSIHVALSRFSLPYARQKSSGRKKANRTAF